MEAAPFLKPSFLAKRSLSKDMVIDTNTAHMLNAESMNMWRLLNLVTYNAMRVPCANDQHMLARLILVFAKLLV
jgi:hypothetical protein